MVERKIIVTCEKLNSFNHYKTSYCPTTYLLTKTKSLLFMRQNIIKYANSVHIFNNNNKNVFKDCEISISVFILLFVVVV